MKATYNTSYTYTSYSRFVSNSDDIDKVYSWDRLAALGETTFHVCILMPLEVKSTDYPISIEFTLDGIDKILDYR